MPSWCTMRTACECCVGAAWGRAPASPSTRTLATTGLSLRCAPWCLVWVDSSSKAVTPSLGVIAVYMNRYVCTRLSPECSPRPRFGLLYHVWCGKKLVPPPRPCVCFHLPSLQSSRPSPSCKARGNVTTTASGGTLSLELYLENMSPSSQGGVHVHSGTRCAPACLCV